jgi:hypothetical protein
LMLPGRGKKSKRQDSPSWATSSHRQSLQSSHGPRGLSQKPCSSPRAASGAQRLLRCVSFKNSRQKGASGHPYTPFFRACAFAPVPRLPASLTSLLAYCPPPGGPPGPPAPPAEPGLPIRPTHLLLFLLYHFTLITILPSPVPVLKPGPNNLISNDASCPQVASRHFYGALPESQP